MDEAMSGTLQLTADGGRLCDEESHASLGRSCREHHDFTVLQL